jgi:hypothetical protein
VGESLALLMTTCGLPASDSGQPDYLIQTLSAVDLIPAKRAVLQCGPS